MSLGFVPLLLPEVGASAISVPCPAVTCAPLALPVVRAMPMVATVTCAPMRASVETAPRVGEVECVPLC